MGLRHILVAATCASAFAMGAHTALAQVTEAPPPSTTRPQPNATPGPAPSAERLGEPSTALSEVVVTANKRQENVQKIPVAVTVVSSEATSRAGVRDFSDLQKVAPSVQVDNLIGTTNIAIRGVRQSAIGPTGDTPTAVHLDGVYLSRPSGLSGLFYDVQRFEVLKGPQGTLYGRNATGGVVNVITNKPTDTFGGDIEAEVGNYNLYRVQGALNAPVNDYLALRGAFHVYGHDGYFSNGFDDADEKGGRLEALIHFSPKAKLLLTGDYELSDRNGLGIGLAGVTYPSPSPIPGVPATQQSIANIPIPSDPFKASPVVYPYGRPDQARERSQTYGFNAQFDYDLDFATATAQFGYRNVDALSVTLSPNSAVPPPPITAYGYSYSPSKSESKSVELRLASNGSGMIQYVVGAYYFTEDFSGDMCAVPSITLPSNVCGLEIGNPSNHTDSYAGFGQVTYTPPILSNKLHLIGGLRYNYDSKEADTTFVIGPLVNSQKGLKADFSRTTYRLGFDYDLTPRNLLYFTTSTGFRAGGFAYGSTPYYQPETITAYELGSKNRFFDGRLQVNAEAFHYDYKGQEVNVIAPPTPLEAMMGLPFSDLTVKSIGSAAYTGASLSSIFELTQNDRLELDVEYLNARYGDFVIPPGFATAPPLGLTGLPNGEAAGVYSGSQVLATAHWSGNVAYDHSWKMLNGLFDARVAVQFSDERPYSYFHPDTLQYEASLAPAYARTDFSVRYTPDAGRWTLTAYVNNLTDERTPTGRSYEQSNRSSGQITDTLMPPLTFGAIFGAKF